jgi:hypothetical protein
MRSNRLIVAIFMERDVAELRSIRDGNFTSTLNGNGLLVSSSVNGSAFSFAVPTMLSPLEVAQFAQLAIDHKANCWQGPTSRTTVRFL